MFQLKFFFIASCSLSSYSTLVPTFLLQNVRSYEVHMGMDQESRVASYQSDIRPRVLHSSVQYLFHSVLFLSDLKITVFGNRAL